MKKIAVITGASSGMGKRFAETVDRYGTFDEVWVIARHEAQLEALRATVPFPVRVLALDLTDVRLMLEPAIAELAARNRTEEEAQRLTEYCDAVRRRIQAGEDYLIEDMRFHWHLAKCSHNMVVEPLMPIIDAAVVSIANITRKELLTATVDTHQEILNGVLDQDPQAARAAVALHLEMNRIVIKHAKERSEKTK